MKTLRYMVIALLVSISLLVVMAGCEGGNDDSMEIGDDDGWAADGDTDIDADGDMDADTDTDSDTDADVDGDGDTDIDGDTDSDADTDGDSDSDSDSDTDTETDTEACDPEEQFTYFLSADDSNSMASPTIARWQINEGTLVTTEIRTYEFLNYYTFDYAAPEAGHLSVVPDLRYSEDDEDGTYAMQIGVRSPQITSDERRPLNLTFSLDTSGSMAGSPLERLKQVCLAIAGNLQDGDVVSIVKWSSTSAILLESHAVSGPDDATLLSVIDGIIAGGSTNLYNGLLTAYELAVANATISRMNRVVLISDGQANAGITTLELIAEMAEDSEDEGIYLSGIGTGNGYDDTLMDDVTDAGKGAYIFIDNLDEADAMFGNADRFLSNLTVGARDVRVELTLPPGWLIEEFHGEEYSTSPSEVDPQHLAFNDAMIFHQLVGTCDDLPVTGEEEIVATAHFKDPISYEILEDSITTTVDELLGGTSLELTKGDAIVAYAETLKEVQALMYTPSEHPTCLALIDAALDQVEAAATALGADPELGEIADLLTAYRGKFD